MSTWTMILIAHWGPPIVSRSQYVWVVTGPDKGMPITAFTVKHELARWLGEHTHYEMDVVRFTDRIVGGVWLDPRTLEPLKEGE